MTFTPSIGKSIYKHQNIEDCIKEFDNERKIGFRRHDRPQDFNGGPFRPILETCFEPTEEIRTTGARITRQTND